MKKGYTHIEFLLDRSASMQSIQSKTIEGFNAFLMDQKKVPGEATVGLTQFASSSDIRRVRTWLDTLPELTPASYYPNGSSTALLDALGTTINNLGTNLSEMKEEDRPDNVVFVVITDGQENSSREFRKETINEMIRRQQEVYGWTFVFLGADQDAIQEAGQYGIGAGQAMTYAKTDGGTQAVYGSISKNISKLRSSGIGGQCCTNFFDDEDRAEQQKQGA